MGIQPPAAEHFRWGLSEPGEVAALHVESHDGRPSRGSEQVEALEILAEHSVVSDLRHDDVSLVYRRFGHDLERSTSDTAYSRRVD